MTINTKEFREEGMKKLGIANLRPQQEAPMEAILNNEDVIVPDADVRAASRCSISSRR